jgi:hypothetical protein
MKICTLCLKIKISFISSSISCNNHLNEVFRSLSTSKDRLENDSFLLTEETSILLDILTLIEVIKVIDSLHQVIVFLLV